MAQVWIGGTLIAQQYVGLSGFYEFLDVPLPNRQLSRIEIRIFDRDRFEVPIEIKELALTNSELLLPAGMVTHMGGGGWGGNRARQELGSERELDETVGFYQWRQGLSDGFTLEAMAQKPDDEAQFFVGSIMRLSKSWISSVGVATTDGELGYSFDLEGYFRNAQILLRSQDRPKAFRLAQPFTTRAIDEFNHALDIRYRVNRSLTLEVVGRDRRELSFESRFILPGLTWRPNHRFFFRARPDHYGDYRFELFQQLTRNSRFYANIRENVQLDFNWRFSRQFDLSVGAEIGDEENQQRYSAIVNRLGHSPDQLSFRGGVLVNGGEVGFLAGSSMRILPGLLARAEYRSLPLTTLGNLEPDPEFLVQLTTDLAFSSGKVRPSRDFSPRRLRGAIAGKIKIREGEHLPEYNLSDVQVEVVDQRSSSADSWGHFYFGNLREGIYRVILHADRLPLELVPEKSAFVVEVVPGATTNVDFYVSAQFGLAGRVTDAANKPVPDVLVEIKNEAGEVIGSGMTDRFGLYRIDGLVMGTYLLQLPPQPALEGFTNLPTRSATVLNDFLFDQNLQLPPKP